MGQRLVALASCDKTLEVVAAVEAEGHAKIGQDAGEVAGIGPIGVALTPTLERKVDVMIDFSSPKGTERILQRCLELRAPLVYATTGASAELVDKVREAASQLPVLIAPSTSLTVNLAMKLCELAAKTLKGKNADVEIIERHHRFKVDSPSGTALKFGKIISDEMDLDQQRHGRKGDLGERNRNELGYHAVRIGDNPGEHAILFGLLGETLEITIKASNRDCYALGALAAAKFLHGKAPGLYSMNDAYGL